MASASNNKLETITQVISLTSNMESTNELLGKIQFPVGGASFKTTSKRASEEKYLLEIKIEF